MEVPKPKSGRQNYNFSQRRTKNNSFQRSPALSGKNKNMARVKPQGAGKVNSRGKMSGTPKRPAGRGGKAGVGSTRPARAAPGRGGRGKTGGARAAPKGKLGRGKKMKGGGKLGLIINLASAVV